MIIPEVTSKPIDRVAIETERKFSIKASAKAFKILSSTIYPDPIAAPIRELATNAADSHKDAGVDEPFLVHLPNELEPHFSIRDYGTGISDANIEKVYCTYFESTRTESNNFTGGFGLGSKTPFCYSDTFSVVSFHNGRKMVYTAFLEDGEPKIAKFADEVTDEKNGLEVSFPVKREDISRFVSTAKKVYSRFVDKPKIVGCADFNLEEVKYFMKGKKWSIREGQKTNGYYASNNNSSYAVMGNIAYPLDPYKVGGTEANRALMSCGVEIEFDVGELQPTVSREHLQYDQDSVKKINDRLTEVCKELQKIFQSKIDASKNLFEARIEYGRVLGDASEYDWQLKTVFRGLTVKFNGIEVRDVADIRTILSEYNKKHPTNLIRHFATKYFTSTRRGQDCIKTAAHIDIHAADKTDFFYDDLDKGGHSRTRLFCKENSDRNIYLIDKDVFSNKVLLDSIFEKIGLPSSVVKLTSSLPKIKHAKRTYVPKSDIRDMFIYNGSDSYKHTYCWSIESMDTSKTDTVYYIDIEGYSPANGVDMSGLSLMYSLINNKDICQNPTKIQVVGLRKANADLKKKSNWISFLEFAKDKIEDHISKNKYEQMLADSMEYNSFGGNFVEMAFINDLDKISKDSVMYEYLEKLKFMKDQATKAHSKSYVTNFQTLKNMNLIGKTTIASVNPTHKLSELRKDVMDKCYMLNYIVRERETWSTPNPERWRPSIIKYFNSVKKS